MSTLDSGRYGMSLSNAQASIDDDAPEMSRDYITSRPYYYAMRNDRMCM